LVVLLNALIAFWLVWTGQPATQLPVVKALTRNQPPHFLFSIYGVERPLGIALSPDGQRIYVAEVGGRVVGQVDVRIPTFEKARHVANLGIAIVGAFRGLGIGRALMERALAWMKLRRVEKATLEVFASNERALALYRKMGFEVEAVRKRHYKIRGEYVDDVMMVKWLT